MAEDDDHGGYRSPHIELFLEFLQLLDVLMVLDVMESDRHEMYLRWIFNLISVNTWYFSGSKVEVSINCTPEASRFTIMHSNPFIMHLYVIGATHSTPARAARVREGTGGQSDRPRRVFGCHPHTTTGRVLGNQYCCFHAGCWSLWTTPS